MAGKSAQESTESTPLVAAAGPSTEERLAAWLQANRNVVAIGAGAVALILAVVWFMSTAAARKENFARTQLEQAWGAADAGNVPLASSEFQKVIDNYGGTEAAAAARLSLNETRLSAGQAQLAADDLTRFVSERPPAVHYLVQANMLLGAALENLGRGPEAAAAYEAASAAAQMDFQKAEALLAAARAYRSAGQAEKAIAVLQTIVEKYPETAAHPVAEVRLGELQKGG